ncbi:MAG: 16S rRNA (guanine(966)-N(2))-methyltransferase RsmD [Acidobacteriota bacterium]|nr:16S rRNA (guanine(966)-N(2))-methyltransferase RsmD [Acidobacteriota bacterium]
MRILAGKYRRLCLRSTASPRVRPTARRLREALFDLLGARIIEARFLDLCAGSGAVGIEALSRGASHVTFVERSARMCGFIEANLENCGISKAQAEVLPCEAIAFLRRTISCDDLRYDAAFFDPPYAIDYSPVISLFGTGAGLRRKGGVLIVEHHCENRLPDNIGVIKRWRVIRQGESCLSFYERQ